MAGGVGTDQVWFTSTLFPPEPGEEEFTNPGRLGKPLAFWLRDRLEERGLDVELPLPEDWGWYVRVRARTRLGLGCANEDGSGSRWSILVMREPSILHRLLRGAESRLAAAELREHVVEIVGGEPRFTEIDWEQGAPVSSGG